MLIHRHILCRLTRRQMLRRTGIAVGGGTFAARIGVAEAIAAEQKALQQPAKASHRAFMERALELARIGTRRGDGTPYGSVVVQNGLIVGEGWNRSRLKRDATAHAEIEAIQDATQRLKTRNLAGCVLYTNGGRPCPMCETACHWANLDAIHYGTSANDITHAGKPVYGGC